MDAPETKYAHYRFATRTVGDRSAVTLEDVGDPLAVLGRGSLSFELKEGVSSEQAFGLAWQLNGMVERIAYVQGKFDIERAHERSDD